jgi:hypothetical protein
MHSQSGQRFLVIYSGILTAVFAVTVLSGFVAQPRHPRLEELDVQRINVREPDGTLRLVISDRTRFPGLILHGKEYPHPRADAGLLFFNDEGTENGGLVFSGHKDASGNIIDSGGGLTFDQYEQDQIVQLLGQHDRDGHLAGLIVTDRPDRPMLEEIEEMQKIDALPPAQRARILEQRRSSNYYGADRIVMARGNDGSAQLSLRDARGRARLVMAVAADGAASLRFLDADGKVVNELPPPDPPRARRGRSPQPPPMR